MTDNIMPLDGLGMEDVHLVGGKNASLGEMISNLSNLGVAVPGGFATTSKAFNHFLDEGGLTTHLERVLPAYRERRDCMLEAMQRLHLLQKT